MNESINIIFLSVPDMQNLQSQSIHCIAGSLNQDVSMAAAKLGVFYISTSLWSGYSNNVTLHLLPSPAELTIPLLKVIEKYQWQTTAVIYELILGKFRWLSIAGLLLNLAEIL